MTTADLIIQADRIYTMNPRQPVVRAMAIVGDRIAALGTRAQMRNWRGRNTKIINAAGPVVLPGLTDSHAHLFAAAMMRDELALAGVRSLDAVLHKIARRATRLEPGQWLVANGFDKNIAGGDFPTARTLDAATGPNVPACLFSRDWHAACLNTRALRLKRITAKTPDPPGGKILRDHRGRPTGTLVEKATELVADVRVPQSERRVRQLWRRACHEAFAYGITTVHMPESIETFGWLQRLHARHELGLRVRYAMPIASLAAAEDLHVRGQFGDDFLRLVAVKIFADGALGSQTAWMYRAYPGRPGYHGIPVCTGNELRHAIRRAAALGLPCWVHAIGDRAVHEVTRALADAGQPLLHHRIEHAQCVHPKTLPLMRKHRVSASVQPVHLCQDMSIADRHWGPAARYAFPFRSLRAARIPMAFGSDLPVETNNPYLGIYAAVARKDSDANPPAGWNPHERIPRAAAIEGYTLAPPSSVGDMGHLGRLAVGAYADFAALTDDPFRCAESELPCIRATHTIISGQLVGGVFAELLTRLKHLTSRPTAAYGSAPI